MNYLPPLVIPPLRKDGRPRPFWSVMIPTYRPDVVYLRKTLDSVLQQAPCPEQMQIEVVDDCSPGMDVGTMVQAIAGERVKFSQTPKNLGLAGCWNTCIERSRGEWVHILHQDDLILPGFYDVLRHGVASSDNIGAAFTRHVFMDEDGQWIMLSDIWCRTPGVLENWLERLGARQSIQTPAIIVKRSVYEELGGFRTDLCFTLDWEMWLRIATRFSFWFEPRILAEYRVHQASETSKLLLTAADMRDCRKMLELTRTYHPANLAAKVLGKARLFYASVAILNARRLLVLGHADSAWKQVIEAFRLNKGPQTCWLGIGFLSLWGRVAGARAKRRLKSTFKAN